MFEFHPKVSEFAGVKFKHPQTLGDKIQIQKLQRIKFKYFQILVGQIQNLNR